MSPVIRSSVDYPWGPGLGGTAPRFQNGIRSAAAAGGREGAGRGGGPASWAVLRWALASSCLRAPSAAAAVSGCRRGGMPVTAARRAWEGSFLCCCSPVSGQGPLASPLPGWSQLMWWLRCGTGPWVWGDTGLLGCSVSRPYPNGLAPRSPDQVLGLATPPTRGWHNQGCRVPSII